MPEPHAKLVIDEPDTVNTWTFYYDYQGGVYPKTLEQQGETYRVGVVDVPNSIIEFIETEFDLDVVEE